MLKNVINKQFLQLICGPVLRRLGTALAAYLAARGVPSDHIDQLIAALTIIAGLSYDVVASLVHSQDVASRARAEAYKEFSVYGDRRV